MTGTGLHAAFVLHARRYGDTSLIVDLFVRERGRIACIAKGVLRPGRNAVASQPFQHLAVEVRGRGEVGTLTRAEAQGVPRRLVGQRLYCGMYLNELLMKLTARHDAHPGLFDAYAETVERLARDGAVEPVLRRFEIRLLHEIGFGMTLDRDTHDRPIEPRCRYTYVPGSGAAPAGPHDRGTVSGGTLLALRQGEFAGPAVLREARGLMRDVLDHHLEGQPLRSRDLFTTRSRDSQ